MPTAPPRAALRRDVHEERGQRRDRGSRGRRRRGARRGTGTAGPARRAWASPGSPARPGCRWRRSARTSTARSPPAGRGCRSACRPPAARPSRRRRTRCRRGRAPRTPSCSAKVGRNVNTVPVPRPKKNASPLCRPPDLPDHLGHGLGPRARAGRGRPRVAALQQMPSAPAASSAEKKNAAREAELADDELGGERGQRGREEAGRAVDAERPAAPLRRHQLDDVDVVRDEERENATPWSARSSGEQRDRRRRRRRAPRRRRAARRRSA